MFDSKMRFKIHYELHRVPENLGDLGKGNGENVHQGIIVANNF